MAESTYYSATAWQSGDLFEAWRDLDPTTRAHDEKTGRDPKYWRNMNEDDYAAFKRENQEALVKHSWKMTSP